MSVNSNTLSQRKKEHIELCLTDKVAFKEKTAGFEKYEFKHYAITEVDEDKINFTTDFYGKKISYPFLISCMTGGAMEAENINAQLADAANNLNIAIGVGSQRQAIENKEFNKSYKIIRKKAPKIPVLGNIGAAQIVRLNNIDDIRYAADLIEADAMVIHANPLQELIQHNGEPNFKGLLKSIEKIVKVINIPVIVKEVGAGISKGAAERLLEIGVRGIDVAGAGGTSWAGVEILRNGGKLSDEFWDWGLPTSYCIRTISKLKSDYEFNLIGSGGINNGIDAAKAFALGADIAASARVLLQELNRSGVEGVQKLIYNWFETVRNVMFLTGSNTLTELKKSKLVRKEKLY